MIFMLSSRRRRVSSYNKESRLNVKRFEFIAGEICEIKAVDGFLEEDVCFNAITVSNLAKSCFNWSRSATVGARLN